MLRLQGIHRLLKEQKLETDPQSPKRSWGMTLDSNSESPEFDSQLYMWVLFTHGFRYVLTARVKHWECEEC
jgi:hypothetical protein